MASPSTASAASRLGPVGKAFFGSLCAGTFGLGCWQTQRFFEKQKLVQKREEDLSLDPAPLPTNKSELETSLRQRVVNGTFQHDKEVLVGPRGPPPGSLASSGPSSGRSEGGMSSSPQGYFVITPLVSSEDGSTVLINRGWVPRHFVQPDNRARQRSNSGSSSSNDNNSKKSSSSSPPSILQWDRPDGQVQVIGIPAKPEQPRMIVPQHDFSKSPPRLFYMDQAALHQHCAGASSTEHAATAAVVVKSEQEAPILLQGIRTQATSTTDQGNARSTATDTADRSAAKTSSFPVQPPLETVGEFKVTPTVHAGYAFTWFGLASAGLVMTRKLITKGR